MFPTAAKREDAAFSDPGTSVTQSRSRGMASRAQVFVNGLALKKNGYAALDESPVPARLFDVTGRELAPMEEVVAHSSDHSQDLSQVCVTHRLNRLPV